MSPSSVLFVSPPEGSGLVTDELGPLVASLELLQLPPPELTDSPLPPDTLGGYTLSPFSFIYEPSLHSIGLHHLFLIRPC